MVKHFRHATRKSELNLSQHTNSLAVNARLDTKTHDNCCYYATYYKLTLNTWLKNPIPPSVLKVVYGIQSYSQNINEALTAVP